MPPLELVLRDMTRIKRIAKKWKKFQRHASDYARHAAAVDATKPDGDAPTSKSPPKAPAPAAAAPPYDPALAGATDLQAPRPGDAAAPKP